MNCIKNGKLTGDSCFGCKISAETCDIRHKLLYRPRWIPVKERLPNEPSTESEIEEYNVTIFGAAESTTLSYVGHGKWYDELENSYNVSAWMPLPEPYKRQNLAHADNYTAQPGVQSAT